MYNRLISLLQEGKIDYEENCSLKSKSSIKIDTQIALLVMPNTISQLVALIRYLSHNAIKHLILGGMSNVLFKNPIYDGVVVITSKINIKTRAENICTVECGSRISSVIRLMAENEYGGGEGLYHIPGTIGGMISSNAGAYGFEISSLLLECSLLNKDDGKIIKLSRAEMGFGYRHCKMLDAGKFVLLDATLSFLPSRSSDVYTRIKELGEMRRKTQPLEPSLGSIFKRINGTSAGYYIERCGLKGIRIGGAEISSKHAGFIINRGDACSDDVLRLIELCRASVYRYFGLSLETEIKIIE